MKTSRTLTSSGRGAFVALVVVSAGLLALRLYAASAVGFGDSEALYACYALHPQAAYLDHPGAIGWIARLIGGGTAPTPARAHEVTSALATLLPWIMAATCRACGATWGRAFAAAVVVALVPEIAIGLFALTPDILLALSWTGTLALAAVALRSTPGGRLAALAFAGAGLFAGIAAASKVSGILLICALAATYASPPARAHARTLAPWAGLLASALCVAPIVSFEARAGWPMLKHRLIDTQLSAGLSPRNCAAFALGQMVYLSPLVAIIVGRVARTAWRARSDAVGCLLATATFLPALPLIALCLWSRVAEPHWIAPALLALAPAAARTPIGPSRQAVIRACALAGGLDLAVHVWALVPSAVRLAPPSYDARLDLTNELYGWPDVERAIRAELSAIAPSTSAADSVVIVAPHWVICAQIAARLRGYVPVGCDTPVKDDFDSWWPRSRWRDADTIIWVTDARFEGLPPLANRAIRRQVDVRIQRDKRTVRTFTISVLARSGEAFLDSPRAQPPGGSLRQGWPSPLAPRLEGGPCRRRLPDWAS